ncbi:MAG: uncharacterized protein PWP07_769 [Epulopiscium sp.]|uniref:DUF438 domain-containing protein n=1 Tax=Defluviitalea raffinosedens TaxID=1450156 RepID=A0A7C8LI05_9FIRM|nr:DUF438 domain-containing protein [Defluviitalea raffinosedens]KAE9634482.1 DUF438 domain-containing protein [Defluviitalea raffinosedens]MBZ4667413.1 domain S-box protein [Defluviitaleaceae bacterium]MDK2787544.1 uncharacterized protein [Candidatus Epulonipiscium sp.]HHW66953.1 DUF438 domain-containing protein [Candidatus Epulonipiscium sp.]
MSEIINNREYRQKILKELIGELHKGKTVDEVKPRFEKLIEGIDATEIAQMEQALIMEGMPVEEIQRLCDVHAAVFKGSIEEIHRPTKPEDTPGHPVHTFKLENTAIERLIKERIQVHLQEFKADDNPENLAKLTEDINALWQIDKHYLRKENLLFPFMEKYGITAPPKVMWGVDDEIREDIKAIKNMLKHYNGEKDVLLERINNTINRVTEMIFKEENILFPMVLETLSEDEWLKIEEESGEIGYTLIDVKTKWKPVRVNVEEKVEEEGEKPSNDGYIKFETGVLTPEEINGIFNTIPLDITFVDKDGFVKYFSQGKERIFPRTKAAIGREVKNCHPPASVHIVEKIVEDLKSGKKENEDFWIKMGDKYVYIRYFAVRDEKGEFLGIMEVTQNIKPIQEITGEKRLVSD